jgi:hypothetical protein
MGMLVMVKDWGGFQDKKRKGMELSTGKILEENLVPLDTGRLNSPFSRTITYNTRPNLYWSCLCNNC